jgi:hypothetical protein
VAELKLRPPSAPAWAGEIVDAASRANSPYPSRHSKSGRRTLADGANPEWCAVVDIRITRTTEGWNGLFTA